MPILDIIPFSNLWETLILISDYGDEQRIDIHDLRARQFIINETFDSAYTAHQWEKRYGDYNSIRYKITQEQYDFLVTVYINKSTPPIPSRLYIRFMTSQLCSLESNENKRNEHLLSKSLRNR